MGKEVRISVHYVKTEDQLASIVTKYPSKNTHRDLLELISEFRAWSDSSGQSKGTKGKAFVVFSFVGIFA